MLPVDHPAPAAVYLLTENLDAALAAGEDLLQSSLTWQSDDARDGEDVVTRRLLEREAFESVRSLETILVARILKSRERAEELAERDIRLEPVAKLYIAGTALLQDAVNELGDATAQDFDTGDVVTAYLRSRGLLADDAPAPSDGAQIAIGEGFLVTRRLPLASLLDLVAMFLDTIEIHYDMFDEAAGAEHSASSDEKSLAELLV